MLGSLLYGLALSALGAEAVHLPPPVTGQKSIKTPNGYHIRYKEPGKDGVCETTKGVKSYSGYIDLAPNMHAWFWFFESRRDPKKDPVTLWLNGGPGSDSQIGLFQEHGPCNISKSLKSMINPYSWNEVSNMIYLSQPYGTGFSYQHKGIGSQDPILGDYVPKSKAPPTGRWPLHDPLTYDKTKLAAAAGWEIIQGFYDGLMELDPAVNELDFNLWTESYGGHYGPAFYEYFAQQNAKIAAGKQKGHHLKMNALGIINGIISERIQAPWYPEFAVHNTYGIKAYNKTVYDYAKFALNMPGGCLNLVYICNLVDRESLGGRALCSEAQSMCRDNVEGPYYQFSGRGTYDIRHPSKDPTPPSYFVNYLNLPHIQKTIGVDLNYSDSNGNTYWAFQQTGDFVYPNFIHDLAKIVNSGVAVGLFYGDADYICNWFGGQAVSETLKYDNHAEFLKAGYEPFVVGGKEYGETRQYGNFSFTRIYESGHEVPYYQPVAALAFFERLNFHKVISDGKMTVTKKYGTKGRAQATHTEKTPPSPTPAKGNSDSLLQFRGRYGWGGRRIPM